MNFVSMQALTISPGANSEKVATSTSTAPSTIISDAPYMMISVDAATYVTVSIGPTHAAPTALATGVHQYLPIGQYRVPHIAGSKYGFILPTGTGVAYLTPGS